VKKVTVYCANVLTSRYGFFVIPATIKAHSFLCCVNPPLAPAACAGLTTSFGSVLFEGFKISQMERAGSLFFDEFYFYGVFLHGLFSSPRRVWFPPQSSAQPMIYSFKLLLKTSSDILPTFFPRVSLLRWRANAISTSFLGVGYHPFWMSQTYLHLSYPRRYRFYDLSPNPPGVYCTKPPFFPPSARVRAKPIDQDFVSVHLPSLALFPRVFHCLVRILQLLVASCPSFVPSLPPFFIF